MVLFYHLFFYFCSFHIFFFLQVLLQILCLVYLTLSCLNMFLVLYLVLYIHLFLILNYRYLLSFLTVYLFLILLGWVIRIISDLATSILSVFVGSHIAYWIRNYLTYLGTVHHELSHALIATLTGAKVLSISLLPRGTTLGSVKFNLRGNRFTRAMQNTLASAAPVYCGALTLIALTRFALPHCTLLWQTVLWYYLAISVFFHMTLSRRDIANIVQAFPFSLPVVYGIMVALGLFGIL